MHEIWLDIPGTGGLYEASSLGRIRSKDRIVTRRSVGGKVNCYPKRGGVIKATRAPNGYLMLAVYCGDGRRMTTVHRLVAQAWKPTSSAGMEINHKDGDKLNNRPENLEWVSHPRNIEHAQAAGLKKDLKPVVARPASGGCPILHPSLNEAARVIGGSQPNISRALATGGTAHGYRWEYVNAA